MNARANPENGPQVDPQNPVPQKYEIAQPLSYSAFPLDPEKKKTPEHAAPTHPERGPQEEWDDTSKTVPAVREKDKDKFIPSEPGDRKVTTLRSVPREKRAVWIVHGMGQQIPFETVDSLTQGLLRVIGPQSPTPRLRTVNIAGQVLQRVELDIDGLEKDQNGQVGHYNLHLYESYWAPKTEGVAKLTDVVSFLWDGGLRGRGDLV